MGFLRLSNGVARTFAESGAVLAYDQRVSVVASGASPPASITGPITSGTAITLPSSGSYTLNVNNVATLQVYLNTVRLEQNYDWNTSGAGPTYTAITITFDLFAGDKLDLRVGLG